MKNLLMIMAMVGVIAMAGVANAAGTDLTQDPSAHVYAAGYDAGGSQVGTLGEYAVFNDGDVNTGDYHTLEVNNAAIVMWDSPVANVNQIVFYGSVYGNGGWCGGRSKSAARGGVKPQRLPHRSIRL